MGPHWTISQPQRMITSPQVKSDPHQMEMDYQKALMLTHYQRWTLRQLWKKGMEAEVFNTISGHI